MKRNFTLLILAMAFCCSAYTQKTKGGVAFLQVGYAIAPGWSKSLNTIAPSDISICSGEFILLGAGSYYRNGKIMWSLDGQIGIQGEYSSDSLYAYPVVGAGHAKFGWIISEDKNCWIYPSVGIGSSFLLLSTYNKEYYKLINKSNQRTFSPSVDLGFNADFIVFPRSG